MMGHLCKEDLSVVFSNIDDPRLDHNKKYPLCEILFLTVYSTPSIKSFRMLILPKLSMQNFCGPLIS